MRFELPSVVATASVTAVVTAAVVLINIAAPESAEVTRPQVAVFLSHDAQPYQDALEGFQRQLVDRGVQAQYEVFVLRGDPAEAGRAIQRMAGRNVDLVYTLGALATESVVRSDLAAPVTACLLLKSNDLRTTPRAAGVSLEIPVATQFEWLHRFLPNAKRVGVLFNPGENQEAIDAASRLAREKGMTLFAYPVRTPTDIPPALDRLANQVDVLWGLPDRTALVPETARPLLLFSLRHRIPFIGLSSSWAKAGALYALDRDYVDLGAQCGDVAIALLQGRAPAELPPAAPRTIVYSVNLKTASHMKIDLSESLVRGASEVFE